MASNRADLIRLLEAELDLIEGGGYGLPSGHPDQERPMFYHSLACINHWLIEGRANECNDDCILMQWVPEQHRREAMPCHFIPLNQAGATVRSLEGDQALLEEAVKSWLQEKIQELKLQTDSPSQRRGVLTAESTRRSPGST